MKGTALFSYIFSFIFIILSITYDTSVYTGMGERSHNLGKLQDQMILLHLGIGLAICGTLLHGFSAVVSSIGNRVLDGEAEASAVEPPLNSIFKSKIAGISIGITALLLLIIWQLG